MSKPTITEGLVPGTHPPIGTKMWILNRGIGANVHELKVTRHTATRFYCTANGGRTEDAFNVEDWRRVGGRRFGDGDIRVVDENDTEYQECILFDEVAICHYTATEKLKKRHRATRHNLQKLKDIISLIGDLEK